MQLTKEALYAMIIGDIIDYGVYQIIKVPGGWVFTHFQERGTGGYHSSSAFVPAPKQGR